MSSPHESHLYSRLSGFYDVVFGPVLLPGIRATIQSLDIPRGARVLEVGVGTGLSLDAYPHHAEVVGIDTSEQMLQRAYSIVQKNNWRHVTLRQMNAMELEFEDASFDFVMAFHILTVVDDYNRLLQEMARVANRSSTIVIVNYLRGDQRWSSKLLDWINPLTRKMGWQTTLSYQNVLDEAPIRVVRTYKTSPGSLFTVLIAKQAVDGRATPLRQFKKLAASTAV